MRTCRRILQAAPAGAAAATTAAADAGGAAAAATTTTPSTPPPPPPQWRAFPIRSWHRKHFSSPVGAADTAVMKGRTIDFFGPRLGPQPLVALPSLAATATTSAAGASPAAAFAPALTAAAHPHGAVCVRYDAAGDSAAKATARMADAVVKRRALALQLRARGAAEHEVAAAVDAIDDGFISDYCHHLDEALHAVGCSGWTTFVAHGFGALVAAKMALLFPERVGALALIDTPLLGATALEAETLRAQLLQARSDVNIATYDARGRDMLDYAAFRLSEMVETAFAAPAAATNDAGVFRAALGTPDGPDAAGDGADNSDLCLDVNAWMSVPQLLLMRVPLLTIVPGGPAAPAAGSEGGGKKKAAAAPTGPAEGFMDEAVLAAHKENLNAPRRAAVITAAATHSDLFADGAVAAEVGAALHAFAQRFDAGAVALRRWQQASRAPEVRGGAAPAAGAGAPAAKAKGGDKKPKGEKKKKK